MFLAVSKSSYSPSSSTSSVCPHRTWKSWTYPRSSTNTQKGTVIEAASKDVESFATGAVFYQVRLGCTTTRLSSKHAQLTRTTKLQIGYTTIIVLIEVIIADITSLRSRLFFSYIPAVPFLVSVTPLWSFFCVFLTNL